MKSLLKLLLFLVTSSFLTSCEKQEYFKSESDVKKELSYAWTQVLMSHDTTLIPNYHMWVFKDDVLTIIIKKASNGASIDTLTGNYSVRTSLTKVFITTYNFPENPAWYWLNTEWTDVFLNNRGLVVASEDPQAGGINELEFTRMN